MLKNLRYKSNCHYWQHRMKNGNAKYYCEISGKSTCPNPSQCKNYIQRHKTKLSDGLSMTERRKMQNAYKGFEVMGMFVVGETKRREQRSKVKINEKRWLVTMGDGTRVEVRGAFPSWAKPNQVKEIK